MNPKLRRRSFTRGVAAAALSGPLPCRALERKEAAGWPIGCFNRPWSGRSYNEALDGMKAAGFRLIGLLGMHEGEPFISPQATPAYLAALKERIESRGLELLIAWMQTSHNQPREETVAAARAQVDHARILGARYLLTTGVHRPEQYQHFYDVMSRVSPYAAERDIQIVLKPHGGCSATATEMLQTIERVGSPNFRIWYDAGNIIHYTDADPVADGVRIAPYTTGLCAKDCAGRGGEVMIQFGEGKVDFQALFPQLKKAGFQGPVLVECCRGNTPGELVRNSAGNRRFLEQLFTRL